jgi:hypothetical protein
MSSSLVTATGGPPVGGAFRIGRESVKYSASTVRQPMVYAIRYQLLETGYVKTEPKNGQLSVKLNPNNIYSPYDVLGDEDGDGNPDTDTNFAALDLADIDDIAQLATEDVDLGYWEEFEDTMEMMEDRIRNSNQ